jgi:hypothetical protein
MPSQAVSQSMVFNSSFRSFFFRLKTVPVSISPVTAPRFGFSALTRKLALKKLPKKYKLKTRKAAVRRFKVVS